MPEALPAGTAPEVAQAGAGSGDGLGPGGGGSAGSDDATPVHLLTRKPCDPDRCQSCVIGKARR
eukprot:5525926-Lingulodinium_polyedra.AAC.1